MNASVATKIQCPIAIEWPIPEDRLKDLMNVPGDGLESDEFEASNIPGVKYSLSLYPNEDTEGRLGQSWIYLELEYSDDLKIKADCVIKIETANKSKIFKRTFKSSGGFGAKFCTMNELFDPAERFVVDGQMIVTINGILIVEKEMPTNGESLGNFSDDLCLGLWNQDEDKNFTVVVGGKEIMVHKCILATRSAVFARMFRSGMKEEKENKVMIEDFPFNAVEMGIKYCYHHSLVTESSLDEKMLLLQFFDKYDIHPLKNDLEAYLTTKICESTVCRLTNAALLSNALKLEKKCSEFLQNCFGNKPISDLELLDNEFALKLFKNSFRHVSK